MGERVRYRRLLVVAGVVAAVVAGAVFVWPGGPDDPPAGKSAAPKPVLKPLRLADRPMWTTKGALEFDPSNVEVVGGTVLIFQGGQRITAFDGVTGAVRWTLDKGHDLTGRGGEWGGGAADVVLSGDAGLLVGWDYVADCTYPPGSPNGRTVTELGHAASVTSCDGDGRTLIACVWTDEKTAAGKVTIFRVDRRTVTTVAVRRGQLKTQGGWSGRAQLGYWSDPERHWRQFTMDGAGNVIDDNLSLPGTIMDVSEGRATVATDDRNVAVYQVEQPAR